MLTHNERLALKTREEHWWKEAQNMGGNNAWGRIHAEEDFKPPPR
jgi:hypothetical protein